MRGRLDGSEGDEREQAFAYDRDYSVRGGRNPSSHFYAVFLFWKEGVGNRDPRLFQQLLASEILEVYTVKMSEGNTIIVARTSVERGSS